MKLFAWTRYVRVKLTIIILLTVSLVTVGAIFFVAKQTQGVVRDQSEEYGMSLAKGIASACGDVLAAGNYMDLSRSLATIGKSYETINVIKIFVAGIPVAEYSAHDRTAHSAQGNDAGNITYESPINVKVGGTEMHLGDVYVEYSMNKYYAMFLAQLDVLGVAGLLMLLGITAILLFALNFFIIRPLLNIEQGTKIIGDGKLDHTIPIVSDDEIGHLAHAFNTMTVQLKVSRDEIEEWNHVLEDKVEERTKELNAVNEKLNEMQFELVQSSKMATVGMLGAGVAHELNNPLFCMTGYADLMLRKLKKNDPSLIKADDFEKYIECIKRESERCAHIVTNLLQFSKKSKMDVADVDVRTVIENMLVVMDYQIRKWNITMHANLPDAPHVVVGNSDKLQQVFINLVANAHHAMPDGGQITIDIRVLDGEDQGRLSVSVTDTGCGIPPESLDKLFDSFFSSGKDMNNLGLGLSISKQIVNDHKGEIRVTSEVGIGTTFAIVLPVKQ